MIQFRSEDETVHERGTRHGARREDLYVAKILDRPFRPLVII